MGFPPAHATGEAVSHMFHITYVFPCIENEGETLGLQYSQNRVPLADARKYDK